MKKQIISVIVAFSLLFLVSCGNKTVAQLESGDITKDNLSTVCDILKEAGLSNVDEFEKWVNASFDQNSEGSETSGFSDADCRMTVMLLACDSIGYKKLEEAYVGTYLMFDIDAIENQSAYGILKDNESLFTTLFGEMPIPKSGFKNAFTDNLDKYGIEFKGDKFSVINILFKAYEEDNAFVGHTGILIDCRDIDGVGSDYLFVEKIAFGDPYKITKINDGDELVKILSARPDYTPEDGAPNPLIYENGKIIGEITK